MGLACEKKRLRGGHFKKHLKQKKGKEDGTILQRRGSLGQGLAIREKVNYRLYHLFWNKGHTSCCISGKKKRTAKSVQFGVAKRWGPWGEKD